MGWMQDIDASMVVWGDKPRTPTLINADEQIIAARAYAADLKAGKPVANMDVAYTLLALAEFCEANAFDVVGNTPCKPVSDGPHDMLIVCQSEAQMRRFQRAFKIDEQYCTYGSSLMGARFDKVIALSFQGDHDVSVYEKELVSRVIREDLPLKLRPGGEMIVV